MAIDLSNAADNMIGGLGAVALVGLYAKFSPRLLAFFRAARVGSSSPPTPPMTYDDLVKSLHVRTLSGELVPLSRGLRFVIVFPREIAKLVTFFLMIVGAVMLVESHSYAIGSLLLLLHPTLIVGEHCLLHRAGVVKLTEQDVLLMVGVSYGLSALMVGLMAVVHWFTGGIGGAA